MPSTLLRSLHPHVRAAMEAYAETADFRRAIQAGNELRRRAAAQRVPPVVALNKWDAALHPRHEAHVAHMGLYLLAEEISKARYMEDRAVTFHAAWQEACKRMMR